MRFLLALALSAASASAADPAAFAVPTFESLGLYYTSPEVKTPCTVTFRAAGATDWRQGYPLVYDAREHQYRGSLVLLQPDTPYEIRLEAGGDRVEFTARTLSEKFPVGKTTYLDGPTDKPVVIREGGSETAWHLVTPSAGKRFTSDVFNLSDSNIVVEADYVILRGLELKNA